MAMIAEQLAWTGVDRHENGDPRAAFASSSARRTVRPPRAPPVPPRPRTVGGDADYWAGGGALGRPPAARDTLGRTPKEVCVPVASAEALPLDEYHRAGVQLINGNPDVYKVLWSRRDDATLANPFGPPARGWKDVCLTLDRAAANYVGGEAVRFENVSTVVGEDLAYIVEIETYRARVVGTDEPAPVSVRVTTVFRREDATWKVVHRHADPITMQRPAESVLGS